MPRRTSDHASSRTSSALDGFALFAGARPDNMAPLKSQSQVNKLLMPSKSQQQPQDAGGVTVLQQGIDTLVLNYYGTLREDVAECLAMAKEEAQQHPAGEANSPLPPFDGVTPRMQSHGVKFYEWLLLSPDVTVTIAKPSRSKRPNAVLRVSSQCLWRLGGGGQVAAELAAVYLLPLFDGLPTVQVSQAHLAGDYQGHPPTREEASGIVKRARVLREHLQADGDGIEWHGVTKGAQSLSAGNSTVIRINLYDKTAELPKHGKEWFIPLWERHKGYVPDAPVWRLEYQFGRELLHDRGIETVAQLLDRLAGLWAYGMRWFSYREVNPGDKRHPSRWPVASWWAALSAWSLVESEPLPRVEVVRPSFRRIAQGLFGYLGSYMELTEREWFSFQDVQEEASAAVLEVLALIREQKGELGIYQSLDAKRRRYAGFTMASA